MEAAILQGNDKEKERSPGSLVGLQSRFVSGNVAFVGRATNGLYL